MLNDMYGDSKSDEYPKRLQSHIEDLRHQGHLAEYTKDGQIVFADRALASCRHLCIGNDICFDYNKSMLHNCYLILTINFI